MQKKYNLTDFNINGYFLLMHTHFISSLKRYGKSSLFKNVFSKENYNIDGSLDFPSNKDDFNIFDMKYKYIENTRIINNALKKRYCSNV